MQGTFIQSFHPPFPSQAFPLRPGLGDLGEEGGGQDRREQAGAAPNYRRTSSTPRRPVSELQSPHSGLRPPNPTSIWSAEPGRSRAYFLQKCSGYHRACLTALGLRRLRGPPSAQDRGAGIPESAFAAPSAQARMRWLGVGGQSPESSGSAREDCWGTMPAGSGRRAGFPRRPTPRL